MPDLVFPSSIAKVQTHVAEDGCTIYTHRSNSSRQDPICIKSVSSILSSSPIAYFEVTVLSIGNGSRYCCAIGLVPSNYPLYYKAPGWMNYSIGYHADDGKIFQESGRGTDFGFPHANVGDTIGLCFCPFQQKLVFTHNGCILPQTFCFNQSSPHAAVGLNHHGESLMVRTCEPFKTSVSPLLTHFGISDLSDASTKGSYSSLPSDLSDHFVELAPPLSLDGFTCPICLSILVNAVESSCCGNLFCSQCCKSSSCPQCRSRSFKVSSNLPVRRMISNLPVECKYCAHTTTRSEFKTHFIRCPRRGKKCKLCSSLIEEPYLVDHLAKLHPGDLVQSFFE
ncbi:hypothetical protein GEMRC1_004630 [Eukaryota sp. GEM-RC1]